VKRRTLRSQLARWLVVPLALLLAANAASSYLSVRRAIDAAYDRSLYASTLAISERVSLSPDGTPTVEVPPVALEVLDTGAQERIFYRVAHRVGAGAEVFVTGYPDLPLPPDARPGAPVFYGASYRGHEVRASALATVLASDPPVTVLVAVAETLSERAALIRELVARDLLAQVVNVVLAGGLSWLGVMLLLRPIRAVSREVAGRSPSDLTEVSAGEVPEEVAPLVGAVNDLMSRVRKAIAGQQRFIADASHALRTPLAILRTQAEIALRQEDQEDMRHEIARLRDTSEATGHLASQLLALARVERPPTDEPTEIVDLHAVARETCSALAPVVVARDVDLGFAGDGPLPAKGRDHQIRELIGNLVDNAMRYGAPGGSIVVSVARSGDGGVCLAVDDDGPGIPAQERSRALRPFHRLPGTPGEGAGLGLAIVNEIARGHGAELRLLDGERGKGLRVEVVFRDVPAP